MNRFPIYLKCIFIFWILPLKYFQLNAQSEPQFSHYMYNRAIFNPAYAGSNDAVEINALHRSQYVGIAPNAINTQFVGFNLPIYAISSGIGLSVVNDISGALRSTYVGFQYNYRRKFNWGKFGIGIGAGFIQAGLDGNKLRAPEGEYQNGINHNDATLPVNLEQAIAPDFSLGVYFNNERWFVGASVNHLVASIIKFQPGNAYNYSRNLLVSGGYDIKITKRFYLMPSAFLKSDFKKAQLDIALNATIADNFLLGFSFRGYDGNSIDAATIFAGFRIKGFRLVYSYDVNLSGLRNFNTGSHEVSAAYILLLKKKERKIFYYHNPRFL